MTQEVPPLTQAQIQVLYTRGVIDRATWLNALRSQHSGGNVHVQSALQACAGAIDAMVARAMTAACAVIQEQLGIKSGDRAGTTFGDGVIARELSRYVLAELEQACQGDGKQEVPA